MIVRGALNSIRVYLTQSIASGDGVNWLGEAGGGGRWWLAAAVLVWRFACVQGSRTEVRPQLSGCQSRQGRARCPPVGYCLTGLNSATPVSLC